MSSDISRQRFNPTNDFSSVLTQQGRVQLDADWNEWNEILDRHWRSETIDIIGRCVVPLETPAGFEIQLSAGKMTIGRGRIYVHGLQAENHGDGNLEFDPILAESRGVDPLPYEKQPYFPKVEDEADLPEKLQLPKTGGPHLVYIDVWERELTAVENPNLIENAVGVDTTSRLQTAWQVRLLPNVGDGVTCATPDEQLEGWLDIIQPSAGRLTTKAVGVATPADPCLIPPSGGYRGLENRTYRVEIHDGGAIGAATFKWSRDNASVASGVSAIENDITLTVDRAVWDSVRRFSPGDWVEITDDWREFSLQPGEMRQIDSVEDSSRTITLKSALTAGLFPVNGQNLTDPERHTRIKRWDQDPGGPAVIEVPASGTPFILEDGVEVTFTTEPDGGAFRSGDYWIFVARTADASVEELDAAAARGVHHHYCRLAIITFPDAAIDCRTFWPPSTGESECGCCCTYTVGDEVNSFGKYTSINDAINALPDGGGEVCILPGLYFENVLIQGRRDVVLRGCGWQTRIASESLKPPPQPADPAAGAPHAPAGAGGVNADSPPFGAVITISQSQHVKLLSFAVEAAEDEVGVLIDGTGKLSVASQSNTGATNIPRELIIQRDRTFDVTVEDLVITASTVPAILADTVTLLQIESNRIAMENVAARWPAVWVSGNEIRIVHNWLGIQSKTADLEWLPATVQLDIAKEPQSGGTGLTGIASFVAPGGIQIAGTSTGAPTRDVFVIENEIDSAGWNGITLGSVAILDSNGNNTGGISGTTVQVPGPCDTTITLQIPSTNPGQPGSRIVAAGNLVNIQINRNRIRNTGACGIGPVGFFDPESGPEIVSIQNLTISANTIARSLLREVTLLAQSSSGAFGAICVPYVENLVIRDNAITDFGFRPGDPVCGIFILYGQIIDISRNQVLETRDWNLTTQESVSAAGIRGGIVVVAATPPSFTNPASLYSKANTLAAEYTAPSHVPGVPALRVEHNVVRVASGDALEAGGFGAFSIVNNHFSTVGTPRGEGVTAIAQTVFLLNLGISIELASLAGKFSNLGQPQTVSTSFVGRGSGSTSNGAITFTDNMCQLEARVSQPRSFSSITIMTLDDLIFGNNQCWVDALPLMAALDAFLLAGSLQATSNRFQEAAGFPVLASGFTIGALNITGHNISTYCLFATGTLQPALNTKNLSLIGSQLCNEFAKGKLQLNFTE